MNFIAGQPKKEAGTVVRKKLEELSTNADEASIDEESKVAVDESEFVECKAKFEDGLCIAAAVEDEVANCTDSAVTSEDNGHEAAG